MNKERYVSYKIAKLLKKGGFAWRVFNFYNEHGIFSDHIGSVYSLYNWNYPTKDEYGSQYCSAPTQQMACRWLREEHNIHIEPHFLRESGDYVYDIIHSPLKLDDIHSFPIVFNTREDAIEAALEYVLTNLI